MPYSFLNALKKPIGSPSLSELSIGKKNVVIIASDHTRPVPSKVIIPPMLAEIRRGNPNADITILISTGCHRETTKEEIDALLKSLEEKVLPFRLKGKKG